MAQIACVKVPALGWAKVEDLIKEALDDAGLEWEHLLISCRTPVWKNAT